MVGELERRDDRINRILQHSSFVNVAHPPGLTQLNNAQQELLRSLLKRSMWLCDHIADVAMNKPGTTVREETYAPLKTRFYEKGNQIMGYRLMNPINNPLARPFQREYIQSLPLEDIAIMYYLVNTLSANFLRERTEWIESDPVIQERATVFEESVLRHGSWYLWAQFSDDHQWQSLAAKIGELGLMELADYETGAEGSEPSLKQGLISRFRELVGSKKHALQKMHIVVRRMILGTNETWDDEDEEEEEEDDDWFA